MSATDGDLPVSTESTSATGVVSLSACEHSSCLSDCSVDSEDACKKSSGCITFAARDAVTSVVSVVVMMSMSESFRNMNPLEADLGSTGSDCSAAITAAARVHPAG